MVNSKAAGRGTLSRLLIYYLAMSERTVCHYLLCLLRRLSTPCLRAGRTAERLVTAPPELPGRFTMSVLPRRPAMPRLRAASGVRTLFAKRMASGMPGTRRLMTASVASGVTS